MLLHNVLCLWSAIRHTTASEYLCGAETLGMTPEQKDRSYPLFGKIPIAPVMGAQLELILTLEVLRPLRKKVLDQLQLMIMANKPKNWFTIYLSCFILLHSCSLATAWHYTYSRRNGVKVSNPFLKTIWLLRWKTYIHFILCILTTAIGSLCYASLYSRASSRGKHSPGALSLLQQGQLSLFVQTQFPSFNSRAK
jgi:hypothetical protein